LNPAHHCAYKERLSRQALPDWAAEFNAHSWAQFFLKFVISHPAVTVVTPATSKVAHMVDNLGAATGRLPDASQRQRMQEFVAGLPQA
jgi:aryl-alcohol dehydrogenase-like predicted oxidoreductase